MGIDLNMYKKDLIIIKERVQKVVPYNTYKWFFKGLHTILTLRHLVDMSDPKEYFYLSFWGKIFWTTHVYHLYPPKMSLSLLITLIYKHLTASVTHLIQFLTLTNF